MRSQEQAEDLARSVKAAVAAADTGLQVFEKKQADANRLYTLDNTRLQEQDNLAVAQGNVALNLINVYRALGGGWQIRCTGAALEAVDAPSPHPKVLPAVDEAVVPVPPPNSTADVEQPKPGVEPATAEAVVPVPMPKPPADVDRPKQGAEPAAYQSPEIEISVTVPEPKPEEQP